MLYHDIHSVVEFVALNVELHKFAPLLVLLDDARDARHIDLVAEPLQVSHQTLLLVARVDHRQQSENADVNTLHVDTLLEQLDDLLKVATTLVLCDQIVDLITVLNDAQTTDRRKTELFSLYTAVAHFLPGSRAVRLPGSIDSVLKVLKSDVGGCKTRIVADRHVQELGGDIELLLEATIGDLLQSSAGRTRDQLFQFGHLVQTSVGVNQLTLDVWVLDLLTAHLEVANQLFKVTCILSNLNHTVVVFQIIGTNVAIDGVVHFTIIQLEGGQPTPHSWLVHLGGKLQSTRSVLQVIDEHTNSIGGLVELLEDHKGLLVELRVNGDTSDLGSVVGIQTIDVAEHTSGVSLDRSQNQEVLQVAVARELAVLNDHLLQQLDELMRQVGIHERLHSDAHLLLLLALRQSSLNHSVNQLATMDLIATQYHSPKFRVRTLNKIASLSFVLAVGVGDLNELSITSTTLVAENGQTGVTVLGVLADHLAIVEGVLLQELLRITSAVIDVDLGQCVVKRRLHVALGGTVLQPVGDQLETVALLNLFHKLGHRTALTNTHHQLLDVLFIAIEVKQSTDHLRSVHRVDLLHVDLDVLVHVVLVEEAR
mmetsp:Transcript_5826/g.17846  ORF Transcript_5826/g.17846 Transcript_5826/m.17846 type:complete len:596 (+) Transcript_5826:1048-2835(+)